MHEHFTHLHSCSFLLLLPLIHSFFRFPFLYSLSPSLRSYLGPFLLSLGLLPAVSAATTSFMTLFTSSSASVQYIALDRVMPDYGLILFLLAAMASYVGQRFIVGPIRKRNMTSLLVLILGGIIASAALLLCITGGMQIVSDYRSGANMGFKALCN